MLIDWFTVFAQIINFIVLVWLLKKLLYKPILKMIADRQNEIAKQLNDAAMKKKEAEEEFLLFQKNNKDFYQEKAERIKKLDEEIRELQEHLRAQVKQDIEAERSKWLLSLKNEIDEVLNDLGQRIQSELFSIMRKALADLASIDIQEQLVDVFLQRLKTLSEKEELLAALHASRELEIRCAAETPENMQSKIKAAIQQQFKQEFDIHFVVMPELLGGIELIFNGQKISWNIADYLSSLERLIHEQVNKNVGQVNV